MVLNASTFPLPHSDLQYFVQFIHNIIAERRLKTTGRGGVLVRCWRSNPYVVGSRLASALSFSHVDVGDACQFINHISHRGDKKLQVDVGDAVQCINNYTSLSLDAYMYT